MEPSVTLPLLGTAPPLTTSVRASHAQEVLPLEGTPSPTFPSPHGSQSGSPPKCRVLEAQMTSQSSRARGTARPRHCPRRGFGLGPGATRSERPAEAYSRPETTNQSSASARTARILRRRSGAVHGLHSCGCASKAPVVRRRTTRRPSAGNRLVRRISGVQSSGRPQHRSDGRLQSGWCSAAGRIESLGTGSCSRTRLSCRTEIASIG